MLCCFAPHALPYLPTGYHREYMRRKLEVVNPVCAGGSTLFSIVLWSWKACLNLFGVVMAAKTWNCEDGVGEVGRLAMFNAVCAVILRVSTIQS